jgi:lipid A 3-O-deacylase
VKSFLLAATTILATAFAAAPAHADELIGGVYVHDVDTFATIAGVEDGVDFQLGWRGDRMGKTRLQPHVFAAVNSAGQTNYAAAGVSMKFGDKFFIRPGIGLAVHTGSAANFQDDTNDHLEFGSRILFAPELGIGMRINDRTTIEASWVHMSNGQIFDRDQNPGIDNLGVRFAFKL